MTIHPTAVISAHASIGTKTNIGPYVVIEGDAHIGSGVTIFAGAYIGKPPMAAGVIARVPRAEGPTIIGSGTVIGAHSVIYKGASIGERVLIGDGVKIRENTTIDEETVVGSNSTIQNGARIGKRVKIVDLSHITFDCVIGDESFISVGVYTMNDNSMQRGGEVVGPKIGDRVRVGGGALLLPGVRLGDDSIVGAGSVVTHHVPPTARVMGVPAKTREQRVSYPDEAEWPSFSEWPPRPYPQWPPEED
jgi:UDP-3-O-[3-hydroxymyristoyl] glucosamine N-acyltransferase